MVDESRFSSVFVILVLEFEHPSHPCSRAFLFLDQELDEAGVCTGHQQGLPFQPEFVAGISIQPSAFSAFCGNKECVEQSLLVPFVLNIVPVSWKVLCTPQPPLH